jgi:hypothetical protein
MDYPFNLSEIDDYGSLAFDLKWTSTNQDVCNHLWLVQFKSRKGVVVIQSANDTRRNRRFRTCPSPIASIAKVSLRLEENPSVASVILFEESILTAWNPLDFRGETSRDRKATTDISE